MPCGRFGGACAPFAPLGSGTDLLMFLIMEYAKYSIHSILSYYAF